MVSTKELGNVPDNGVIYDVEGKNMTIKFFSFQNEKKNEKI